MSLMLDNQLRRRRRALLGVIALFAVMGVVALAGVAMSGHAHGNDFSDVAALCVAAGMCVAVSAGVLALRRPPASRWRLRASPEPTDVFVPVRASVPVRAGPLSMYQAFRL